MQFDRRKSTATAVSLFLMFAIAVSLVALPLANAHDPPWQIPTFAFVQAVINPVGVGQTTYIYMFVDKIPDGAALGNDVRFHDYKLTITKPDGTKETKTWDVVWDPTSSQGYSYTPDQAGTYTLEFTFPGQKYTWTDPIADMFGGPGAPSAYINDTYLPSSASATLTVQEETIPYLPDYPLPTEYWTRPIYGDNTNWWQVSSNWLGSGSPMLNTAKNRVYVPDGVGPRTSHIMWTKPIQLSGGVVGGDMFEIQGDTFFEGSAYINRFVNPIILDGKLYYKEPLAFGYAAGGPTKCVDLRTGEEIWSRTDVPSPSFGYIYAHHDPQQHGVWPPILIATGGGFGSAIPAGLWMGYDADTGEWLFNATNVPSGASAMGLQGEYLQYIIANAGNDTHPDYRLGQWNSSKLGAWGFGFFAVGFGSIAGVVDGSISDQSNPSCRYDWNVSIPWRNTMTSAPTVVAAWYDDIMLCYNGSLPQSGFRTSPVIQEPYTYFAVNLNESKGAVGSVLWRKTYNPPVENITVIEGGADPVLGVFVEKCKETNQWVGYNLRTGEKLWGPVGDQPALDYYGNPGHERVFAFLANGNVYSSGYGGVIFCYDEMTGDLLWTYGNGGEGNSTNSGWAVPGPYPTSINAIANGILYTVTTEHTVQTPIYKGATARAINATDGTEIWTISAYTGEFNEMNYAVADGYATWFNGYDNRIYSVGKGPSATTVSASPKISVHGSNVLVEGMVTDIAAGTTQDEQAARFPNGVPAVADESMSDWMEYVYMQKPRPTDVVGVEVVLTVLDPNTNYYEVGRTTTDADGFFSCMFTPEVPGQYTIIATFEGSEGYWPSHAETAIGVEEAPAATPEPTPVPQAPVETYFTASTIAIIIAIAIVGFLLFRRRP